MSQATDDTDRMLDDLLGADQGAGPRRGADDDLPSSGLLSFYDRLRQRVVAWAGGRSRAGGIAAETVLLAPDVFMLLVRLAIDREVPAATRSMIGGALAYFLLPVDVLPEALIGVVGYVDDVVLASIVLSSALGPELEPWAARHWSGSQHLRAVLTDVSQAAELLLGERLYARLRRVLARRGVEVEAEA